MELAQVSAGWMRELIKKDHKPETEEYGIKSFVYRRNRPFHPKKFKEFLDDIMKNHYTHIFKNCIRCKGTIWLASRHIHSFTI